MARRTFAQWGNDLYTGEQSYPIVRQRKRWYTITIVLMAASLVLLLVKGLTPGMEFTGGTQFQFAAGAEPQTQPAFDVMAQIEPGQVPQITVVGGTDIRIRMGVLTVEQQREAVVELAGAYGLDRDDVTMDSIGPTWGQEVGNKALRALVIFVLLAALTMAVYFRSWRMSVAALVALAFDLVFTVGIYSLVGFEVTPAAVIGFLTILGYSLYDTVVVFDKVRENTQNHLNQHRYTYAELANLGINQTIVRSINTSIVSLLPVSAILFIGSLLLGAGTLVDIALALFVGIAVGTYSSMFIATPALVSLQLRDEAVREHTERVLAIRESGDANVVIDESGQVRVGALTPGGHRGVGAQPKRKRRK